MELVKGKKVPKWLDRLWSAAGVVVILALIIYYLGDGDEKEKKASQPAAQEETMPTQTLPQENLLFEYTDDMEPLAYGLEAGKKYRVIGQLVICPYHSDDLPDDAQEKLMAIANVRQLKGEEFFITVLEVRPYNGKNWYRVKWQDETGWVNSSSLINRVEPAKK